MSLSKINEIMKRIEEVIAPHPKIYGFFYGGSTGRGNYDEYSDIDVYTVVKDEDAKEVFEQAHKLFEQVGQIKFIIDRSHCNQWVFFIDDEYIKIDFGVNKISELKPKYEYREIKIIKDTDGFIKNLQAQSLDMPVTIPKDEFKAWLEECRDGQIYAARHCARGWVFSALGEAAYEGEQLFYLLTKLRGIPKQYGFRNAENILDKNEFEMLLATRPREPTVPEVRKAMKAVWKFLKLVEAEYEEVMGEPVGIICDEEELLAVAEKIYEEIEARSK